MIFIIHHDNVFNNACPLGTTDILRKFESCGAFLISQSQFAKKNYGITENDQVIVYISIGNPVARAKLREIKCRKLVASADESCGTGPNAHKLFLHETELCKQDGFDCVITAQITKRNIDYLVNNKMSVINFPGCTTYEMQQNFDEKKYDICISGNANGMYPHRQRLRNLIMGNQKMFKVHEIAFAGYQIKDKNTLYGKRLYEKMSQSWLGLVTKVGWHDRLVAKYFEFGKAWVLPMGNYPSSLDKPLQESMLNIPEELTDREILDLITTSLHDKQTLRKRITSYHEYMVKEHDIDVIVPNVIKKIVERQYDWDLSK